MVDGIDGGVETLCIIGDEGSDGEQAKSHGDLLEAGWNGPGHDFRAGRGMASRIRRARGGGGRAFFLTLRHPGRDARLQGFPQPLWCSQPLRECVCGKHCNNRMKRRNPGSIPGLRCCYGWRKAGVEVSAEM